MFITAVVAVVVGCVVAQPPPYPADLPNPPESPALPGFPFNMEGCDMQGLQRCMAPLMASSMMRRGPNMGLTSTDVPTLDTACRLLDELKLCILPRMKKCGPEATSAVSAAFDAVNYLCVDARNETQKYMNCLQKNNNAAQFGVCVSSMIQGEAAVLAQSRNPRVIKQRMCSLIKSYEVCAEKKAGSVCNEEALVTNFFNILNKGLSFLQCPNLGVNPEATQTPSRLNTKRPRPVTGSHLPEYPEHAERQWKGRRPGMMGPLDRSMKCMQRALSSCMTPTIELMAKSRRQFEIDVDEVCAAFNGMKGCMAKAGNMCGEKAKHLMESMEGVMDYLCVDKRDEFKSVSSCMMKGLTPTVTRCMGSLNAMETRGDIVLEEARKPSDRVTEMSCRAISSYGDCISHAVERQCGYQARDLLDGIQSSLFDIMQTQMGVECPPEPELIIDPMPLPYHHHHHHRALKIALPIAGVVVLAIIVAIVFAVRRSRGANRRQQLEKADLVKNDLLQQNLRFAITQTPKEKSQDGLKV